MCSIQVYKPLNITPLFIILWQGEGSGKIIVGGGENIKKIKKNIQKCLMNILTKTHVCNSYSGLLAGPTNW